MSDIPWWFDLNMVMCSILFGYSIIPQIIKNYKSHNVSGISWQFCIVHMVALSICVISFAIMDMLWAMEINAIQIILWLLIIYQKVKYVKHK